MIKVIFLEIFCWSRASSVWASIMGLLVQKLNDQLTCEKLPLFFFDKVIQPKNIPDRHTKASVGNI